jgi:phospholipid/cholesterol/gamma-HCH transport system substrate-binding protein
MTRRVGHVVAAAATALALTSCASLNVNALPLPGNSHSGGYDIVMEFASVLNLPDRANVMLDQRTVGSVTGVTLRGDHVDVTARIDRDVEVPSNVQAVLQQATILGDIYVALERPQTADVTAGPLAPGARIALAQTTSPPQLEDTIAYAANFISSGSIQRIQNTIVGINRVTPPPGQIQKITYQVSTDISDLSNNIDVVDQLLTSTSQTADVLNNRIPSLEHFFSDEGMRGFDRASLAGRDTGKTLPSVGSTYSGGFWLVPLLKSLADAGSAVQRSKWAVDDEIREVPRYVREYLLPQDKFPAINITSIIGPDGRELSGNVQDVLRILGATQ